MEGSFHLGPAAAARLAALLAEQCLEGDHADALLLGREVRANGRSVARVNGRAVTTALLGERYNAHVRPAMTGHDRRNTRLTLSS